MLRHNRIIVLFLIQFPLISTTDHKQREHGRAQLISFVLLTCDRVRSLECGTLM